MSDQDMQTILSRLDRLESQLNERHIYAMRREDDIDRKLGQLEGRIRSVEINQAKLLVLVGATSTLSGIVSGVVVALGRAFGIG